MKHYESEKKKLKQKLEMNGLALSTHFSNEGMYEDLTESRMTMVSKHPK